MEIKIKEWNVNFGSDKDAEICEFAKEYINDTDIIVFTEVIDNDSIKDLLDKLDSEYIKYASKIREVKQYNQIVIAVKTELIPCSKIRQVDIDEKKWDINSLPDICHLEIITSEGKLKNVIGTRVRIDGGSNADYKDRRVQFENLVRYIEELENVIVLGDFNNGMLKADSDKDYDSVKDKYEKRWDKKKKKDVENPLRFYNFHLMKHILGENYILKEITGEESSWGLSLYNDVLSYGLIKNDQIITKNICLKDSYYDWGYVRDNEWMYKDMLYNNRYKRGNKIEHGYPDHAILNALIEL